MIKKAATVAAAVAVAVVTGVAAGSVMSTFSDVPSEHEAADAIAYSVTEGWFTGYEDGTFRPGRRITDSQMTTVFNRAFPAGSTRAEFAQFLRAGERAIDGRLDLVDVADDRPILKIWNYGRFSSCHREIWRRHPSDLQREWCDEQENKWSIRVISDDSNLLELGSSAKWVYYRKDNGLLDRVLLEVGYEGRTTTGELEGTAVPNIEFVADGLQKNKVGIRVVCRRYPGWSDVPLEEDAPIPSIDCAGEMISGGA